MKNKIIAVIMGVCLFGIMVFAESFIIDICLLAILFVCGLAGGFDKDFLNDSTDGKKNNANF